MEIRLTITEKTAPKVVQYMIRKAFECVDVNGSVVPNFEKRQHCLKVEKSAMDFCREYKKNLPRPL